MARKRKRGTHRGRPPETQLPNLELTLRDFLYRFDLAVHPRRSKPFEPEHSRGHCFVKYLLLRIYTRLGNSPLSCRSGSPSCQSRPSGRNRHRRNAPFAHHAPKISIAELEAQTPPQSIAPRSPYELAASKLICTRSLLLAMCQSIRDYQKRFTRLDTASRRIPFSQRTRPALLKR